MTKLEIARRDLARIQIELDATTAKAEENRSARRKLAADAHQDGKARKEFDALTSAASLLSLLRPAC